jgi:glycosyltransferase involved in cell wall biosynthesis
MTATPLVSFCMSTYKRPVQLKEQLQRILSQVYSNIEIIVSDNDPDCSAKEPSESLNDPRIKYFANVENLGMVKSFNKSVERSSGDFVVMITDDDPVYDDMAKTLVDLSIQFPGYGVYAGCGDWIVETEFSAQSLKEKVGVRNTVIKTMQPGEVIKTGGKDFPSTYIEGILSHSFLLWSCCIVERSVIMQIKGMPDYGSELLTDHAYMIAASSKKGMVFINKALGGQSVRGDNFGYNFEKIKGKYLSTPKLFYDYLKSHLQVFDNWKETEEKLWKFIGRGWVEYSLMIYRSLKEKKQDTKEFFTFFNKAFSDPHLRKWKLKFYLKAYFRRLFRLLIKLKPA